MHSFGCQWLAATLSPEMLILSLSSGAEQFTGYSARELVGRPVIQILADKSAFELPRIMDSARQWGTWEGNILHQTRDGQPIEARSTLSLLAGAGNRAEGYLLISNTRDASAAAAQCADPALVEIAGHLRTFSHDLNNPLAVIMGFTQLLMLNPECQGKLRGDVEKVYSELKRIVQTVEKLHGYAMSLYERPLGRSATSA